MGLFLIEDATHAIGATVNGQKGWKLRRRSGLRFHADKSHHYRRRRNAGIQQYRAM